MTGKAMRSVAFAQSIGVFEGGGVRGAAFAGAYRAATKAGIKFVATVGTSSGSIAAAFISAGMDPDEVEQELKTDFAKLLRGRRRVSRNAALRVLTSVLGKYS